jgi:hypothetical protein
MRRLCWLLLACPIVFADDALESAIRDLRSDVPATRDAAHQRILDRGPDALPACREALEREEDTEAKARLETICAELRNAARRKRLPEIWRDRLFRIGTDDGREILEEPCGRLHVRMETLTQDGEELWNVRVRVDHPRGKEKSLRLTEFHGELLADASLTPKQLHRRLATLRNGDVEMETLDRVRWDGRRLTFHQASARDPRKVGRVTAGADIANPESLPVVLDWMLPAAVERASLERAEFRSFLVINLQGNSFALDLTFEGEATLRREGRDVTVRRYAGRAPETSDSSPWDFQVSDELGLLRGRFNDMLVERAEASVQPPSALPPPDRRALRETHAALWSALRARDWPAVRSAVGEEELRRILDQEEIARARALEGAGPPPAWLERFGGAPAQAVAALPADELAARTYFGALPDPARDAAVAGITLDSGIGEVEVVLPWWSEARVYSYLWDGRAWRFRHIEHVRDRPVERATPRERVIGWRHVILGDAPAAAWNLLSRGAVCAWMLECGPELEAAKDAGDAALRVLAGKHHLKTRVLKRMSAYDYAELNFAAEATMLREFGDRKALEALRWGQPVVAGETATIACTEGLTKGTDWALRRHGGEESEWRLETDLVLKHRRERFEK